MNTNGANGTAPKPVQPSGFFFIATVQITVRATSSDDASDKIERLLEGQPGVEDWGYLKVGRQFMYPIEFYPTDSEDELIADILANVGAPE